MFGWFSKRRYNLVVDGSPALPLQHRETVLNGAIRHGLPFPHSCKVGGCASCKCQLVSGKVKELTDKSYLLSKAEIQQNYILGCQSIPVTDVVVALPADPLAQQRIGGTVVGQKPLTHDIMEIELRLAEPVRYRSGQYASVTAVGTSIPARCYSFADAGAEEGRRDIRFVVRAVPEGRMSHWLMSADALNQPIELQAALGDFYLRDDRSGAPGGTSTARPRDLLCVAGGSGLAPLMSMLEGAAGTDADRRDVFLLMGARRQRDLYYLAELERLRQRWRGRFELVPVLSEEPDESGWSGRRGWVTEAITAANTRHAQGYLCGPPPMIDAAIARMTELGVPRDEIFFDKFLDQSRSIALAV